MLKLKSYIFLILTVLFSVTTFASNTIPPDKGFLESIQSPVDLNTDVDLATQPEIKLDEMILSKRQSINRGKNKRLNLLVPAINRFAVVQNQNFDRMHNSKKIKPTKNKLNKAN